MRDQQKKLNEIFKKEQKIEAKRAKLDKKLDKLFDQKSLIAFDLHSEFIQNNQTFYKDLNYYRLYIESGYFMVEALIFEKRYDNLIEFKHKSPHRQNQCVNLFIDTEEKEYNNNSAIIDQKQFDRLSNDFEIKIRA